MPELIRKTLKMLKLYPILWVPFVAAYLCTLGLLWLTRIAIVHLRLWSVATHSVLAPNLPSFDAAAGSRAEILSGVLQLVVSYISISIGTVALVLTAILVGLILHESRSNMADAVAGLRAYPNRILWYSFLLFALFQAYRFLFLPGTYLTINHAPGSPVSSMIIFGEALVSAFCTAWIMAPIALALLRPANADPVSADQKMLGRYCFLLAGLTTFALSSLFDPWIGKLTEHFAYREAVFSFASLLFHIPELLSYLALALIVSEVPTVIWPTGPSKLEEFFKRVRPLHNLPKE